MSKTRKVCIAFAAATIGFALTAVAAIDPIEKRSEIMKGVGKAAKPVGTMFKGERDFDAAVVAESLQTWKEAAMRFGRLFPEGSESGGDTEAAPAIWEDRAGFEQALTNFLNAVNTAIEADPQTLEAAKPTVGPVFKTCKGCHDNYRIKKD